MTRFYVLLGDVVQSREIDDRAAFRQRLEDACRDVTARYPDGLYTDVTVLKGVDEIGAVLLSIADVYRIVTDLAEAALPDCIPVRARVRPDRRRAGRGGRRLDGRTGVPSRG